MGPLDAGINLKASLLPPYYLFILTQEISFSYELLPPHEIAPFLYSIKLSKHISFSVMNFYFIKLLTIGWDKINQKIQTNNRYFEQNNGMTHVKEGCFCEAN